MKKQGFYCVLAAIAIQLTLGIAYIWSIFQTGVADSIFGGDNAAAGLTFSLLLALLTIGSVIGGRLAAKYSTRIVVFTGGIILSAGFFLASLVTAEYSWLLWLTYGVMGGAGMGYLLHYNRVRTEMVPAQKRSCYRSNRSRAWFWRRCVYANC